MTKFFQISMSCGFDSTFCTFIFCHLPAILLSPTASIIHCHAICGGGFDDLWSMSHGSAATNRLSASAGAGKSIWDLEKEKAQAGIWGAQSQARPPAMGGFWSFASNANAGSGGGGAPDGADDLLL